MVRCTLKIFCMREKNNESKNKKSLKDVFRVFVRILKWAYRANRIAFPLFLFFLFIISIIPFVNSYINSKVIDEIVALLGIGESDRVFSVLIQLIVFSIVLTLIEKVLWVLVILFEKIHYFGIARYCTMKFLKKVSGLDMYHYENEKSNDIIQKAQDIYEWRPKEIVNRFAWMGQSFVRIVSSMVIVLNFSVPAFLLVFFTTVPNLIINFKFGNDSWGIWDANVTDRRRYSWTTSLLSKEESLMEFRIFRTRNYLLGIVSDIFDRFTDKEKKNQIKRSVLESIVGNFSAVGVLVFWVLAIVATINGEITIGLLTFYLGSINNFSDALSEFFRQLSRQYEDSLYLIDFFKFMDLENKINSGSMILSEKETPPVIEFRNINFAYPGTDKLVLNNFNLVINSGERIAFVGENGVGKTTIVKILSRFYDVSSGEILIDGVNLKDLDFDSWYKQIGVLFQDFIKYSQFDVRTNIELGDIDKMGNEEQLNESLFKSDAKKFVDEYKNKLDQVLDKAFEGGINPSSGQWQRIALARAFFRDAPILILDEPTSAIDAKAEYEIFERLYKFSEGKTVIIISHRFSTVRNADKIYVIDKGRIVESGSHEELLEFGGKYKSAFEKQAEGYK